MDTLHDLPAVTPAEAAAPFGGPDTDALLADALKLAAAGTAAIDAGDTAAGVTRRGFLGRASLVAGSFVLAFGVPLAPRRAEAQTADTLVGAWVRIAPDGTVTVMVGNSDMGQGVWTALPQILAEELKVPWAQVRYEVSPASSTYGNPLFGGLQLTGGSTSVRGYHDRLRTAGAAVREMLVAAAAAQWGVSPGQCIANGGRVRLKGSDLVLGYGELAAAAALQPVPSAPAWTPNDKLQLIGQSVPRLDLKGKVDGSAVFGLDVRVPGMVYAAVVHCPRLGGTLAATPPVPRGALGVVPLGNAVAVIAGNTWEAFEAADRLQAKWTVPASSADIDSAVIAAQARTLLDSPSPLVAERNGDVASQLTASRLTVDATYSLPYLAHACMEVLTCTASVTASSCEIWAPTQAQGLCVATAAAITQLPPASIQVHTTMLGGGLGRKFEQDFIRQAVLVSKAIGKPVKLTWKREQDFMNDQYRPMALARVRAGLDAAGQVNAFWVRSTSPSITGQRRPLAGVDSSAVEGSVALPYAFTSRLTEWVRHPAAVPVGYWRSVGHSINAFVVESALDELAAAGGIDPYALRRQMLASSPRALAVLDRVAELARWGKGIPAGRARGMAFHESFGSLCAQVAEVSRLADGRIKVHRVTVVIDCGRAINPSIVRAQMQGGVVHGLAAALWGQVQFNKGTATARNFSNYRMLRMAEMPTVVVDIIDSGAPLGGIGEPGVPPVAPAVANAWARLTGLRVRSLPMFPADGRMGEVG